MKRHIKNLAEVLVERASADNHAKSRKDTRALVRKAGKRLQSQFGRPHLPLQAETVAVTFETPKTAALCFDRVWSHESVVDHPPPELYAYGATQYEIYSLALSLATFQRPELAERLRSFFTNEVLATYPGLVKITGAGFHARSTSEVLAAAGLRTIPVYSSAQNCDAEYAPGRTEVVVTALQAIEIVDESALSWEQVVQFRQDNTARNHFRKLVHWLDTELVGKPASYIADEMGVRLERYDAALRKHGIQTALGAIEAVFDPKFLGAASAITGGLAFASSITAAVATGAALAVGRVACTIARSLVDRSTELQSHAPIAFIHHVRRLGC